MACYVTVDIYTCTWDLIKGQEQINTTDFLRVNQNTATFYVITTKC